MIFYNIQSKDSASALQHIWFSSFSHAKSREVHSSMLTSHVHVFPLISRIVYLWLNTTWLNIVKNEVYLWYVYCSNLFGKMRREVNFGNTIAEILRKSRREEREMMWRIWEREKRISTMILPKKNELGWLNCRNWRMKKRKKRKRKLNCGKSNVTTTH